MRHNSGQAIMRTCLRSPEEWRWCNYLRMTGRAGKSWCREATDVAASAGEGGGARPETSAEYYHSTHKIAWKGREMSEGLDVIFLSPTTR